MHGLGFTCLSCGRLLGGTYEVVRPTSSRWATMVQRNRMIRAVQILAPRESGGEKS